MSVMREFAAFFSGVGKPGKRFAGTRSGSVFLEESSSSFLEDDDARTNAWRFNRDDDDDASVGRCARCSARRCALAREFGATVWSACKCICFCKESYPLLVQREREGEKTREAVERAARVFVLRL